MGNLLPKAGKDALVVDVFVLYSSAKFNVEDVFSPAKLEKKNIHVRFLPKHLGKKC